jgi:hypothetical protein
MQRGRCGFIHFPDNFAATSLLPAKSPFVAPHCRVSRDLKPTRPIGFKPPQLFAIHSENLERASNDPLLRLDVPVGASRDKKVPRAAARRAEIAAAARAPRFGPILSFVAHFKSTAATPGNSALRGKYASHFALKFHTMVDNQRPIKVVSTLAAPQMGTARLCQSKCAAKKTFGRPFITIISLRYYYKAQSHGICDT